MRGKFQGRCRVRVAFITEPRESEQVLVENIVFKNGHGATIGSVPDGNGLHGFITNVTFRAPDTVVLLTTNRLIIPS